MSFLKVTLRFQNTTFDQEQIIQKDNRFSLSVCCERDMEMSKGTDIDFFYFLKNVLSNSTLLQEVCHVGCFFFNSYFYK